MSHIKVFIVEDDTDWIKALTTFLNKESDLLVVGTATNSTDAINLAQTLTFDVVLMDIQLEGSRLDGIHTAILMHEHSPAKIIMLTSLNDEQTMTQAFTAGAVQYLEKTRFQELPQTIRNAYHHSAPMEALLNELTRLKREEQLKELTGAEREVFELIEAATRNRKLKRSFTRQRARSKIRSIKCSRSLACAAAKKLWKK